MSALSETALSFFIPILVTTDFNVATEYDYPLSAKVIQLAKIIFVIYRLLAKTFFSW